MGSKLRLGIEKGRRLPWRTLSKEAMTSLRKIRDKLIAGILEERGISDPDEIMLNTWKMIGGGRAGKGRHNKMLQSQMRWELYLRLRYMVGIHEDGEMVSVLKGWRQWEKGMIAPALSTITKLMGGHHTLYVHQEELQKKLGKDPLGSLSPLPKGLTLRDFQGESSGPCPESASPTSDAKTSLAASSPSC